MIIVKADTKPFRRKLKKIEKLLSSDTADALTVAGAFLEGKMVEKIEAGLKPAILPATKKAKGSSVPLFDTGEMLDQIDSRRVDRYTVNVGVFGSRAEIAKHHEFGAPDAHIPERSFMRSAYNENKNKIVKIMSGKF